MVEISKKQGALTFSRVFLLFILLGLRRMKMIVTSAVFILGRGLSLETKELGEVVVAFAAERS